MCVSDAGVCAQAMASSARSGPVHEGLVLDWMKHIAGKSSLSKQVGLDFAGLGVNSVNSRFFAFLAVLTRSLRTCARDRSGEMCC